MLKKSLEQSLITIAGYKVTGQFFFLFTEKVISERIKLFTNLFWLPQITNQKTRANKKDNIPLWHFQNEVSFQKKTGFSVNQIIFVLSIKIHKD